MCIDVSQYENEESIKGDSEEDTLALKDMVNSAKLYVESFDWAPPIKGVYMAFGIGGVVAVFLVEFSFPLKSGDVFIWVVNGDLPGAYMVVDDIKNPRTAMGVYCELMEDWANTVLSRSSLLDVFPVRAEPSEENAKSLLTRVAFLRKTIIPLLKK